MDLIEIRAEIARLTSLEKDLKEAAKAEGQRIFAKVPVTWDYRVQWEGEHKVRVEKKYTEDYIAKREAHLKEYPDTYVSAFSDFTKFLGMTYIIGLGYYIEQAGGGHCILDAGGSFASKPRKLTDEEFAALKAGTVPDSLLAKAFS